ncbi:single-stranded-DNA-specific exonuclease RecJ [Kineothrix sp. MB12-C1]|uniref:single-stranded-DNA-specific exonuclease RecJ n=1 Tax=Kineothrix sp. MB12-C1 TaxID=3070215 RepID=UPI0027D22885|nr:single-stranded-DNA-specific exonuclease RecJ [Kineothrix sp. MB12-C1]WMC92210.1 single-stranded-DNA-specific exonuclease RecJ [Kineothrix sp. MB12-C1]
MVVGMAKWFVAAKKADFNRIAKEYGIDPVLARIIRNRDVIEEDEIRRYLKGGREDFYAPELLKDMDKAVSLLCRKIKEGSKIRVIGDYDADGICSSYILLKGLSTCLANVDTVIPHRVRDGYGLNDSLIEEAHGEGVDTIVTCDNGIAAASQISHAKELGMTVIVTDHHEIPYEEDTQGRRAYLIPGADAVVNPKQEECTYPYKNICGGVVAYKVIQELFSRLSPENGEEVQEELLEIAAFATVCDVMELRDENRILVKCGLENMRHTRNEGLRALIDVCGLTGKPLSSYHIGFMLGPCMNATGRLDTAKRALLLLSSKERSEAVKIAEELKNLNDSRKELTLEGTEQAIAYIESENRKEDKVLVIYLPECHESLAGIIAGRIREKYGKPAFVLTKGEEGVKGSGRSIESYHMYEQMSVCKEYFTRYGGHKMAAGLSMEESDIESFRKKINESCLLTEEDFEEKVHIDVAMPFSYLTKEFIKELDLLEPFGVGNPKPVFAQKNVRIISERIMGKNKNVGKYSVCDEAGQSYEMIYFGDLEKFHDFLMQRVEGETFSRLQRGQTVNIPIHITYYPSLNTYAGKETIQIVMQNYM